MANKPQRVPGPHQNQPLLHAGAPLAEATAGMIMVHGRGASAANILTLAAELDNERFAYLAPAAAGHTWYSFSFLAPTEQNEPGISSGLQALGDAVTVLRDAGLPYEKIMLLGFSQGACLALEFVARHPRRYGGVAGLSGGLIGPPETPRDYPGNLADTPVFLGCSDVDMHIPMERVQETTVVLRRMGATVTERLYPGMGHTVNADEPNFVRRMMGRVLA